MDVSPSMKRSRRSRNLAPVFTDEDDSDADGIQIDPIGRWRRTLTPKPTWEPLTRWPLTPWMRTTTWTTTTMPSSTS